MYRYVSIYIYVSVGLRSLAQLHDYSILRKILEKNDMDSGASRQGKAMRHTTACNESKGDSYEEDVLRDDDDDYGSAEYVKGNDDTAVGRHKDDKDDANDREVASIMRSGDDEVEQEGEDALEAYNKRRLERKKRKEALEKASVSISDLREGIKKVHSRAGMYVKFFATIFDIQISYLLFSSSIYSTSNDLII